MMYFAEHQYMRAHLSFYEAGLQEEEHEHGHRKREGKQEGKSDKRITESKARQTEALHGALT
jgi:hypothetical protein